MRILRSTVVVALLLVLIVAGAVTPAAAQSSFSGQLFFQVYRLIRSEALAPPEYSVLLEGAVRGMDAGMRALGLRDPVGSLAASGNEDTDVAAVMERLEQATAQARGDRSIAYAAIRGMVESVAEANTVFLTPSEMTRFEDQRDGSFVGIGVQLVEQGGRVVIAGVLEDSPAAAAGVLPDDVIVAVDGQPTQGRSLEEVRRMIAGEEGTVVTLGLLRPSTGRTLSIPITRARITTQTASARMLQPGVGYLRLTQFTPGSAERIAALLAQLQQEGARGLIFDVRNNPGGLLSESIDIASHFLQSGVVITMQGRERSTTYLVRPRSPKFTGSVVLLVNRGSASASEVVAGALQDVGIKLIGERTYGKATVQTVYQFRDGSGLRLTIARYLTRNGRDISQQGLTPDLDVGMRAAVLGTMDDVQLQRALAVITDLLRTTAGQQPGTDARARARAVGVATG